MSVFVAFFVMSDLTTFMHRIRSPAVHVSWQMPLTPPPPLPPRPKLGRIAVWSGVREWRWMTGPAGGCDELPTWGFNCYISAHICLSTYTYISIYSIKAFQSNIPSVPISIWFNEITLNALRKYHPVLKFERQSSVILRSALLPRS